MTTKKPKDTALSTASDIYENSPLAPLGVLTAALSDIPGIGGIDRLLSYRSSQHFQEKVKHFFAEIEKRLEEVEGQLQRETSRRSLWAT